MRNTTVAVPERMNAEKVQIESSQSNQRGNAVIPQSILIPDLVIESIHFSSLI